MRDMINDHNLMSGFYFSQFKHRLLFKVRDREALLQLSIKFWHHYSVKEEK